MQEISELYHAALELPSGEREAFLKTCADENMQREVKALLADAELYAREGFAASDGQRTPPPREPDLFTERAPEVMYRSAS